MRTRYALLFGLLGLATSGPLAAQEEEPTFTVRGEVLDAVNGRPLVGVLVTMHDLWMITRDGRARLLRDPRRPCRRARAGRVRSRLPDIRVLHGVFCRTRFWR